ncbi:NGFI-A-binding protein homolog isoform X1 [Plodia interpunctella]|uniref:NGFI-A-binding protein homolog isoform X1 n=1 Tax=Plodia interpunctella TaxID=58824 RepID=UPI002368AA13|nr:NGFI-A-binding protein homolog isoform X1 [Plodia interpunctella]
MCASERGDMESPGEETGRSAPPAHTPAPPQNNGSNKIIGRNVNGTMVVTSAPANEAELQLYRVMQRASLLAYYDTLLEMGGDDVQQLCDAGEEEFLEIMALVGMASKPLHVRRLQKALQEWVTNPALFQIPIVPNLCPTENPFMQCNQRLLNIPSNIPSVLPRTVASPENNRPMYSPSPGAPENSCGSTTSAPNASPIHQPTTFTKIVLPSSPAPTTPVTSSASRSFSPQSACPPASAGSSPSSVTSPVQLTPVLLDIHVQKLAAAAEKLSKHLSPLEPKPQNTKKKMCKELELVMMMPESDPRRMEEIRKYAAIYGRFDCKRKPEKPLTLHEVMVNEAAAQMCRCVPALLTRRDELFPLARQLVRRAGLHYSKHGLPPSASLEDRDHEDETPSKRPRQDGEEGNGVRASPDAARSNSNHSWWGVKAESDDADSRCSYSSTSTPPPDAEESRPQVVAARGDSIIAVANPALQPPHPARNHSN